MSQLYSFISNKVEFDSFQNKIKKTTTALIFHIHLSVTCKSLIHIPIFNSKKIIFFFLHFATYFLKRYSQFFVVYFGFDYTYFREFI